MSNDAVRSFVEVLARHRILEANELDGLRRTVLPRCADPHSLFRELVRDSVVTPYQANQLLAGKGPELVLGPYILMDRLTETVMG
jgi:hypothetical protein